MWCFYVSIWYINIKKSRELTRVDGFINCSFSSMKRFSFTYLTYHCDKVLNPCVSVLYFVLFCTLPLQPDHQAQAFHGQPLYLEQNWFHCDLRPLLDKDWLQYVSFQLGQRDLFKSTEYRKSNFGTWIYAIIFYECFKKDVPTKCCQARFMLHK